MMMMVMMVMMMMLMLMMMMTMMMMVTVALARFVRGRAAPRAAGTPVASPARRPGQLCTRAPP